MNFLIFKDDQFQKIMIGRLYTSNLSVIAISLTKKYFTIFIQSFSNNNLKKNLNYLDHYVSLEKSLKIFYF